MKRPTLLILASVLVLTFGTIALAGDEVTSRVSVFAASAGNNEDADDDSSDDDIRQRPFQVDVQINSSILFPPGHVAHNPATAGLLRDDCTAMGWATFVGDGMGRVSYIGGVKNEQSHCAELAPSVHDSPTGVPTGFFLNGEYTFIGEGTDASGQRDTIYGTYQPNLIPGINTGLAPWCNPMLGPCPAAGLGQTTTGGGTGRFSNVVGGTLCTAWLVIAADNSAEVFSDCTIEFEGGLPGRY